MPGGTLLLPKGDFENAELGSCLTARRSKPDRRLCPPSSRLWRSTSAPHHRAGYRRFVHRITAVAGSIVRTGTRTIATLVAVVVVSALLDDLLDDLLIRKGSLPKS
jgi:hypothetical protein